MVESEELNRMRWAARRGMLELDLVLEPYVMACYSGLETTDRRRLRRLLECEDQELFAWLMQREQPADEELVAIVDKILQFTHTPPEHR